MFEAVLFKCFLVRIRIRMSNISRINEIENREDDVLSIFPSSTLPASHHLS
ncbi:hypothetical protein LINPERHAP1_LOCUS33556 [Linum perenne]